MRWFLARLSRDSIERVAIGAMGASITGLVWVWFFWGYGIDAAGAAALLVVALLCFVIAIEGRDLLLQIRKIGPIEFGLIRETASALTNLPDLEPSFEPGRAPWVRELLTPRQSWLFELGADLLMHLQHTSLELSRLTPREVARLRSFVLEVSKLALNERQNHKALDFLRMIEPLNELTYEEAYFRAIATFRVADEETDAGIRKAQFQRTQRLLEECAERRPGDASVHWLLAYVFHEFGMYDEAIRGNDRAIQLDHTKFDIWGNWNKAVALLFLGKKDEAYHALERIPEGEWWNDVAADRELAEISQEARFMNLLSSRRGS